MGIVSLIYFLVVSFVRMYKWGELQLIKLFIIPIIWVCREAAELTCGIVFQFPEDDNGNGLDEKEYSKRVKSVSAKCRYYKTVIHLKVHNKNEFFARFVNSQSLGYGEAYMDGLFDYCNSQDELVEASKRFMETGLYRLYYNPWNKFLDWLKFKAFNLQNLKQANHYNLGNDMFKVMLDPQMQYTCGYWASAANLNEAQIDKLELIAQKLNLKPGMRVLDLGCGRGTLCKYLAEKYDANCVGVTTSKEEGQYGQEKCKGLNVEIRVQDYRELNEQFDRVVTVGMMEHVGHHNYSEFFEVVERCLKKDGIFLLHTAGVNNKQMVTTDGWIDKYIFPGRSFPRMLDIVRETDGTFVIEDWHNFGLDYAKTINAWRANLNANWSKFEKQYGKRFYRMWILYLCVSEGLFKSRSVQLWQVVISKGDLKSEYRAAR